MAATFVKAHEVRKNGPVALIIPVEIRNKMRVGNKTRFHVGIEGKAIVYTPVPPEKEKDDEGEAATE